MEIFTFIIAVLLLGLMVADWVAAYILYHIRKTVPDNIALRERSKTAKILSTAGTLSGILALIRLFEIRPPNGFALVVLSVILILISVPNIYWLYLYFSNKLHK